MKHASIWPSVAQALSFDIKNIVPVWGGDINAAYCIDTARSKYFVKVNDRAMAADMFAAEAAGLRLLAEKFQGRIPKVLHTGFTQGHAWLITEWLSKGAATEEAMTLLGRQLANLHVCSCETFGLDKDNFIGNLVQRNTTFDHWVDFYTSNRILLLVKVLVDRGHWQKEAWKGAEAFCGKLPQLLPVERPALLHGDLWSGNFMICDDGIPALFDPAVYYGHREMDIAMAKLFGGFSPAFYDGYQSVYPLTDGWEERLRIHQLYPVLVHAVLFGGHYVEEARGILNHFQ